MTPTIIPTDNGPLRPLHRSLQAHPAGTSIATSIRGPQLRPAPEVPARRACRWSTSCRFLTPPQPAPASGQVQGRTYAKHVRSGRALHRREDARSEPRPLARRPDRARGAGALHRRGDEAPGAVPPHRGRWAAHRMAAGLPASRSSRTTVAAFVLGKSTWSVAGADLPHRAVHAGRTTAPSIGRPPPTCRTCYKDVFPVPLEGRNRSTRSSTSSSGCARTPSSRRPSAMPRSTTWSRWWSVSTASCRRQARARRRRTSAGVAGMARRCGGG